MWIETWIRYAKAPSQNTHTKKCNSRSRASNTNFGTRSVGWHRRRQTPLLMAYSHCIVVFALEQILFQNNKKKEIWRERKKGRDRVEESLIRWIFMVFVRRDAALYHLPPAVVEIYCAVSRFPARTYAYESHRCRNTNEPTGMVVCAIVRPKIKTSSALYRFVLQFLVFHRVSHRVSRHHPHSSQNALDILSVARTNWARESDMTHNTTARIPVNTNDSLLRAQRIHICCADEERGGYGNVVAIDVYD